MLAFASPVALACVGAGSGDRIELASRGDDDLMQLAKDGNSEAFDVLVRRYQVQVLRLAARHIGRVPAVADIGQNAFLAIYRSLSRYEGRGRFAAYLYRTVLNECRMANRANRSRARISVPLDGDGADPDRVASPAASAEAEVLERERERALEMAVSRLSDKLRDVMSLRFGAGLSHEEIAETLQLPVGTVKRRLFDAMGKLRQYLEES
jgi:RNA polymerase sigma-70 factor (ECF subfamily)